MEAGKEAARREFNPAGQVSTDALQRAVLQIIKLSELSVILTFLQNQPVFGCEQSENTRSRQNRQQLFSAALLCASAPAFFVGFQPGANHFRREKLQPVATLARFKFYLCVQVDRDANRLCFFFHPHTFSPSAIRVNLFFVFS
jgi:hypothetical protein